MAVDITLIITNWNGRDLLRECLPSIQKAVAQDTSHTYEVMVIDDCSSDDSLKILEEEFPWVRREKTPQNLGFQGANNHAARLADSPIIMLLNNDIKLHLDALQPLANHFDNDDVFAVSGRVYDFDDTFFLYGNRGGFFKYGHFSLYEKPPLASSQTLFACGGAFMVDRRRYLQLGGFDTLFHPLYYEEIDLSYRALKRGWQVRYEPDSIVYHKVRGTIAKQEKARRLELISARNNYLFVFKNILDWDLTLQFLLFVPLFLIRDAFRLKSRFWIALGMAFQRLPAAWVGRRKEQRALLKSDREVLQKINAGPHHSPEPPGFEAESPMASVIEPVSSPS